MKTGILVSGLKIVYVFFPIPKKKKKVTEGKKKIKDLPCFQKKARIFFFCFMPLDQRYRKKNRKTRRLLYSIVNYVIKLYLVHGLL